MDHEQFKIGSYDHWDPCLQERQSYLGGLFCGLDTGKELAIFLLICDEADDEFSSG